MSTDNNIDKNESVTSQEPAKPVSRLVRHEEVINAFTSTMQSLFAKDTFAKRQNVNGLKIDDTAMYKFGENFKSNLSQAITIELAGKPGLDRSWLLDNQQKISQNIIDSGILQPKKAGIVANGQRYLQSIKANFDTAKQEPKLTARVLGYMKTALLGIIDGVARLALVIPNLYQDYSWRKSNFGYSEIQPNDISTTGKDISPAKIIAEYIAKAAEAKDASVGLKALIDTAPEFKAPVKPVKIEKTAPETCPTTKQPVTIGNKTFTPNGMENGGATNFAKNAAAQQTQGQQGIGV